jgi:hypothetical protein
MAAYKHEEVDQESATKSLREKIEARKKELVLKKEV